ncbi:hypothetical protein DL765_003090 [Monosporascus sp. GIB2]|nr:hypothetical protein DL765_003090 [Monosporascus sp. GIB2]
MSPAVDPAITEALCLDPSVTKIASHGGSGFASTFKLSSTVDGKDRNFFVKTGTGSDAEVMFRGEHASLNAIHSAVPNFCPRSYAHGAFKGTSNKYFMVTDFLDLGASGPAGSGDSLAKKLAKLHTTPAPVPEGFDRPMFGFPVTTCCGSTPQDNSWKSSWADFYANNRLRTILQQGIRSNGSDVELSKAVEKTASVVVPRLLGDDRLKGVVPVVVHGDLWSGNHGRGRLAGEGGVEEVVFDPSAVYAHSEYELGIMKMFGGFGTSFWKEYETLVPKAEPKEEWEDRVSLYELKAVIVGISGASSSGKTTLARLLRDIFPNTFILHEDDFYKPESELPTKDGLLDWDCAEALSIPDMTKALSYIREHGTFPPFVDSKEDQNTVGECPVPDATIEAMKAKVRAWLEPGRPGHAIFFSQGGNGPPLRVCLLDGFLLYARETAAVSALLDVRLLLRVSQERATARRGARDGYVTLEGFWSDPPGYVEKIVWPNYVASHAWLFEGGDVEGRPDGAVLEREGILAQTERGVDADMDTALEWAVETLMRQLEEICGVR